MEIKDIFDFIFCREGLAASAKGDNNKLNKQPVSLCKIKF